MVQPNLPAPPHRARFPDPTGRFRDLPEADQAYMRELIAALQREFDRLQRGIAQPQLLLLAPDNSVWSLKVDASGVLATSLVANVGVLP